MRKTLWILLSLALPACAQVSTPGIIYVTSAPSGACSASPPIQVVISTGAAYTCDNGTWAGITGGGGSFNPASPGPIGNTTPGTGAFTTLTGTAAGAASAPALSMTGAPYSGGTGTTAYPLFYLNDGTAPTTWRTAGTEIGVNAPSGFSGAFIDFRSNGGSTLLNVDAFGDLFSAGNIVAGSFSGTGSFGTLAASSTVSGAGFSAYLASPPPIGSTAPNTGSFTTLSGTTVVSGTPTTAAQNALPTGTHGFSCDESSTTGVPAASVDYLRCDSTTHSILESVNGGAESPLGGVANYWSNGYNGAAQTFFNPANYVTFALMQLTQTTSFTGITYYVQTADTSGSDHYDLGIYSCPSSNCTVGGATTTLVCDIGPTVISTAGAPVHHACAQGGTITLGPGTYVLAATGSATTGAFGAASISNVLPIFTADSLATNSSAGQLPSSNTLPSSGTWGFSMPGFAITLH